MDGVRDRGLNVVDLDDVVGLVDADSQRQILGLFELVALADLVGIVVDHAAVIGLGGLGRGRIELAVVVVLDGVVVLIDRPLCVQVVRRGAVDTGLPACCECKAVAAALRVPAVERVALALVKPGRSIGQNLDQAVVRDVVGRNGAVGAKVAVVGDGDRLRCLAVNGGQFDIAVDRDRVVRVILVACGVHPVEEDLAIGGGVRTVEDGGGCALAVVVDIGNSAVAVRGIIGHGVAGLAAELGSQDEVAGDLRVLLERLAVFIDPAEEVLAIGGRGGWGKGDGSIVRNVLHRLIGLTVNLEGDLMHRRGPMGVNGDVLRGHGLVGEVIGLRARGVGIPAVEDIRCVDALGSRRRVASGIGDGGPELVRLLVYLFAVVHIDHVVVVAVVVEFGVVVVGFELRTYLRIEGIAGDGVLVLCTDCVIRTWAGILVVRSVVFAANEGSGLAGEHLYIVISSFTATSGLGTIEGSAAQGHRFDVDLIWLATRVCLPSAAAVNGRPLIADESAVLGGDGLKQLVSDIMATKQTSSLPLDRVELHLIHVALVAHVDDGGAVACDGLLLDRLRGEAVIFLGCGRGLITGSAGFRLGFLVGILGIVGIFQPVDHGVADRLLGLPLGGQLDVIIKRAAEGERGPFKQPAIEGEACFGRVVLGLRGAAALGHELRRYVGAAVGIEGDPMALLHLGVERNVLVFKLDGVDLGREILLQIPAGDGLIALNGEGDVGEGDRVSALALPGGDDAILRVDEEDVEYIIELRIEPYGVARGDRPLRLAEALELLCALVPSGETLSLCRLGRFRRQQRFTFLDDLLVNLVLAYVELVGEVRANVRLDDLCRLNRVGRQHVQRQHRQGHDKDHDPCEEPLAGFHPIHKKSSSFLALTAQGGGSDIYVWQPAAMRWGTPFRPLALRHRLSPAVPLSVPSLAPRAVQEKYNTKCFVWVYYTKCTQKCNAFYESKIKIVQRL